MRKRLLGVGLLAGLCASAISGAEAQTPPNFYQGKTLKIMIGYGPGSGYDFYARVLSHHIAKHIPGAPNVIVEYMPGAASLTMMNHLYNVAERDGAVIGLPERSLIVEPLYGNALARFDAAKFSWLGSMSKTTALCFTWHTSGVNAFDDAREKKVIVGSTGASSPTTIYPRLLNKLFGTKFEPLIGYPDSGAIGIAMENGELQGYCGFTLAAIKSARPDWLSQKKINILAQLSIRGSRELPDAPVVIDMAKDDTTRQALTLAFADQQIGFAVAGPPGVPADRLAILRKAFESAMEDVQLREEAKKLSVDLVEPAGHEAVEQLIRQIYATPKSIVDMERTIRSQ